MPIVRLLAVALVAALLGGAGVGFAASVGVASTAIGGGAAVVGRCHTGPVSFSGVTAGSTVTAVQLADLDPACDGGLLRLVVVDHSGSAVATGTTTVPTSRPVDIVLDAPPHRNQVVAARLVVEGP